MPRVEFGCRKGKMVSRETLRSEEFFDLSDLWFKELFDAKAYPWELLAPKFKEEWISSRLKGNTAAVRRNGFLVSERVEVETKGAPAIVEAGAFIVGDDIELQAGVLIEGGAWVKGPTILGDGTTVRQGAYVRGGVITGRGAVIGHATEVKSSIFLNDSKAAHFAYVGDSILGNFVNLGAGTKISNLKMTGTEVVLETPSGRIQTGSRKIGGILGDHCETGCNAVLNPGVLMAPKSLVYPCVAVKKNFYPARSRIK